MSKPIVTVIVPTRDRHEFLAEALESMSEQKMQHWECIVVDDGSTPPVQVPEDERFVLVRNRQSLGPAASRNVGIKLARGEYIAFLDDDDALTPRSLAARVAAAGTGRIVIGRMADLGSGQVFDPDAIWEGYLGGEVINRAPSHCQGLFPQSSILEYDESFRTHEDFEWWLRMGQSHEFVTVDEVVYRVRKHRGPRVGIGRRTHLEGREMALRKHGAWFSRHPKSRRLQLERCAAAALNAEDKYLTLKYAGRACLVRPSMRSLRLVIRALLLIPRP